MPSNELTELQKEFRQSVLASLTELKRGQQQIEHDIQDMRLHMVEAEAIEDMQKRITALEKTKTQMITAVIVSQGFFVCLFTLFTTFFYRPQP